MTLSREKEIGAERVFTRALAAIMKDILLKDGTMKAEGTMTLTGGLPLSHSCIHDK